MSVPENPSSLYVGLMSGTSMDGIDAALVRLHDNQCETIATKDYAYPPRLRSALLHASRNPGKTTIDTLANLDHWVGSCFRDAATALLEASGTPSSQIQVIGSHGQTIRHCPHSERPFTLQIGDPNIIASGTGITTVADFRRRDLAAGGEGAPLTPAFHQWLFAAEKKARVVLNIGGIANITVLAANRDDTIGFDTGPGNGLMDAWTQQRHDRPFDDGGAWARSGEVQSGLLSNLLQDVYFSMAPPKSTGFEYFNLDWLESYAGDSSFSAADIQATLLALTARSIGDAITRYAPDTREILVCGGGINNVTLMESLSRLPGTAKWLSTDDFGLDPNYVEAIAFAWLARQTILGQSGNLPSVTGAKQAEVLGGIYVCGG